jgi:hypothetical protein
VVASADHKPVGSDPQGLLGKIKKNDLIVRKIQDIGKPEYFLNRVSYLVPVPGAVIDPEGAVKFDVRGGEIMVPRDEVEAWKKKNPKLAPQIERYER